MLLDVASLHKRALHQRLQEALTLRLLLLLLHRRSTFAMMTTTGLIGCVVQW